MPTVWLWEIEWATGFQYLPKHVPASDIDNALEKAKAHARGFNPSVIRGLRAIAHFQVKTEETQDALFSVEPLP